MSARTKQWVLGAAVAAVAALTLSACAPSSAPSDTKTSKVNPKAKVTIEVGEKPPANKKALLDQFTQAVAAFEKKYPNITLKPTETKYNKKTFSAQLAAGTTPTTFAINFPDMEAIIDRGQAADITQFVKNDKVLSHMNPNLLKVVQKGGDTYGIVRGAYTMALLYNRTLYKKAGLDPDKPPTTWAGVLRNAKTIKEKTGKTGFIIPTTKNNGGWLLTTMAYANGNLLEKSKGKKVTATVDTKGMKSSLEFLHDVRWKEDAAGANFLMGPDDIRNAYAAGTVGQTINGGNIYKPIVMNRGMPPEDVGIAPLPQAGNGLGALGGGAVQWFNPKATPNQIAAAVKWAKFYYLRRYTDKSAAVDWAKASAAAGDPVGFPRMPLFSKARYKKFIGWIKPYINVDRDNYTAYLSSLNTLPVVPEPEVMAQQLYGALDSVAQAVLTKKDADIDQLLKTAEGQVQALIDAG